MNAVAAEFGGNFGGDYSGPSHVSSQAYGAGAELRLLPKVTTQSDSQSEVIQRLDDLEQQVLRLNAENEWFRERMNGQHPGMRPAESLPAKYHQPFEPAAATSTDSATAPVVGQAKVYEVGKQTAFSATWRNGLQFQTEDGAFRMHVGGRLHGDIGWWQAEDDFQNGPGGVGPLLAGANYRRARIRVNGTVYDTINWVMEYGFESGAPAFFDTFMELPDLPVLGAVRIGHFREPFSLDALTSGNDLMLMERSLIHDSFVPFRNVGVMVYRNLADESMTLAAGGFRGNSNSVGADADDGSYAFTTRATWNPWYEMDGVYALHFGAGYSIRNPPSLDARGAQDPNGVRRTRFATRPEIRVNAPNFADTGLIDSDQLNLFGLEAALGSGPLLIQAEYVAAVVSPSAGAAVTGSYFHGFYVQSSWFLTGENRAYNRKSGVFGRAKPYENFFWREHCCDGSVTGWGAWEAAIRYSWLDLNDDAVRGGELSDISLGLNWHLNPSTRFMFNYILIDRDAPIPAASGSASVIASRFQIDF